MGKANGKKRRMRKKFNYGKNRKRAWNKSKKLPEIKCAVIKENWEAKKGVRENMTQMGLSYDPNFSIKIPHIMELIKESFGECETDTCNPMRDIVKRDWKKEEKTFVLEALKKEAAKPMDTDFRVSNDVALFAKYMREKYGENYKEMARDPRNYYQLTPKQIKKKINDYDMSRFIIANKLANKEDSGA